MRFRHAIALSFVALVGPVAFVGCRSIDEDLKDDAEHVAQEARDRIGTTARIASPQDSDEAVVEEIKALLAHDLDEECAVRIALVNNPALRVTLEQLGLRRLELVQAGLLSNPLITANTKFFSAGPEVEFGLSQSILDVFLVPLRKSVAESQFVATKAEVTREIVHLVHEVRRTIVAVQATQQQEALAREVVSAAQASFELMEKLHAAGNVPAPNVSNEAAAVSRAKLDLAAAQLEAREERANLDLLLGLRGDETHWKVVGELGSDPLAGLNLEDIETRAVASSLDLEKVGAEIEAANRTAALASRQSIVPQFDAGIVGKRETGGEVGLGPSIALGIPVFDTGAARVAYAGIRLRERLRAQTEIATQIEIESRRLRDRATSLAARAKALREELLPALDRFVHETLQNYNAMQIGAFDVLEARHREMDAKRETITTLRDAWFARVDLDELLQGALAQGHRGNS